MLAGRALTSTVHLLCTTHCAGGASVWLNPPDTSVKSHSLDFTEGETDSERSSHMPQVKQLEKGGLVGSLGLWDGSSWMVT